MASSFARARYGAIGFRSAGTADAIVARGRALGSTLSETDGVREAGGETKKHSDVARLLA